MSLFVATSCYACTCIWNSVCTLKQKADVIFRGKAVAEKRLDGYGNRETQFEVLKTFKGNVRKTRVVRTGTGYGDCSIRVKVGSESIVFASFWKGKLTTSRCSGTVSTESFYFESTEKDLLEKTPKGRGRLDVLNLSIDSYLKEKSVSSGYLDIMKGSRLFQRRLITGRERLTTFLRPGKYKLAISYPVGNQFKIVENSSSEIVMADQKCIGKRF